MPNILLTTTCNRRCPYCFALDAMSCFDREEMTFEELVHIADMLVAAQCTHAGLLGGEPTLHPDFADIVLYMNARRIAVRVFTNALCTEAVADDIESRLGEADLHFVVNVNFPEIESPAVMARQETFLRRFGKRCDISVNIFQPDLNLMFVRDVVERTDLRKRRIRLGFAQPIVGERNQFLDLEAYRNVAAKITALAEAVFPFEMGISLDCGFPLCSFTDAQLGSLRRHQANTKFVCGVPTDIAPTLKAWSCFPLTRDTMCDVGPYGSLGELQKQFRDHQSRLRDQYRPGVFEACRTCAYRLQGVCEGGCMAHVVSEHLREDG